MTSVKFANDEKSLLAYSSMNGLICICRIHPDPVISVTLHGHLDGVTGRSKIVFDESIYKQKFDEALCCLLPELMLFGQTFKVIGSFLNEHQVPVKKSVLLLLPAFFRNVVFIKLISFSQSSCMVDMYGWVLGKAINVKKRYGVIVET